MKLILQLRVDAFFQGLFNLCTVLVCMHGHGCKLCVDTQNCIVPIQHLCPHGNFDVDIIVNMNSQAHCQYDPGPRAAKLADDVTCVVRKPADGLDDRRCQQNISYYNFAS